MGENRIKVLFILHLPPPVHGAGVMGEFIENSALINKEFNSYYINLSTSRLVAEIGSWGLVKWLRYLIILFRCLYCLVIFRPSLVYITLTSKGIGFYRDVFLVCLVKAFRKKIIFHLHNKGVSEREKFKLDNFLYKNVFKNTDVILLSKLLYPDVAKYVEENRVHYCPNGIPDNFLIKYSDKKCDENSIVKILFLSNLIESKGPFILLEACAILRRENVAFECIVVGGTGDITLNEFMNKVNLLGLSEFVDYRGSLYGTQKEMLLLNTDIFVLPTYYHNECFPLVLLEAMQFSLPIITTGEGSISDIVENDRNGFIVPNKDSIDLAEKLILLIGDVELRKFMGRQGRRSYEERFTLNRFEKRIIEIINLIKQS